MCGIKGQLLKSIHAKPISFISNHENCDVKCEMLENKVCSMSVYGQSFCYLDGPRHILKLIYILCSAVLLEHHLRLKLFFCCCLLRFLFFFLFFSLLFWRRTHLFFMVSHTRYIYINTIVKSEKKNQLANWKLNETSEKRF